MKRYRELKHTEFWDLVSKNTAQLRIKHVDTFMCILHDYLEEYGKTELTINKTWECFQEHMLEVTQ